jgi:hypothetical protein
MYWQRWLRPTSRVDLAESAAAKAPPVVSYRVARIATALLTGCAFLVILGAIGLVIAAALTRDVLQLQHARLVMAIGLCLAAFFAGHSGAIGLLDGYSQGRFRLPDSISPPPSAARARNPWRVACLSAVLVGVPYGTLAFFWLPQLWPAGIARQQFVGCFAAAGGVVSALIVWVLTGRRFLDEAQLAPAQRRFAGSHAAYLWQRHALPQALINAFINGWMGVALVPGRFDGADAGISAAAVQLDVRGTAFVLAAAIALGVRTQARFDLRWGIIAPIEAAVPRAWWRAFVIFGSAPAVALLVAALYAALGLAAISPWTFVLFRGLACALYCGAIAYWVARWNLSAPAR